MTTTVVSPAPVVGIGRRVMVDTNVLVYATSASSPLYTVAQTALDALDLAGAEIWASRQILREYLAAMTRPQPFANPVPISRVVAEVNRLAGQFRIAEDSPAVFTQLLTILSSVSVGGRQVHDANIVATMLAHGIPNVLTHNTADFNRFSGYITVVPLVPPPPPGVP